MTKNELKEMHKKFQRDVSIFNQQKNLKAIDVMVIRHIKAGENDVNELSKAMKITKDQLISSISKSIFKIKNDTIYNI